jgi:hypothetical protein
MTIDPDIEARVRAKRAAPLDQDRDALALLDEVERLRDALADEHATMLLSNANALRAQHEATDGDERWAREQARIVRERDAAIAACAEMRALLERGVCQGHDSGCNPVETHVGCAARALLAHTSLGAGVVVVPREVWAKVLRWVREHEWVDTGEWDGVRGCDECGRREPHGHTPDCYFTDLDVLLGKVGG